ncbi:hypothetical protein F5B20DRAFT_518981 [Whalleya microplaca]|nr:hypothetical protein F5B20DRAFT_518981 [Whalleya microplaca]
MRRHQRNSRLSFQARPPTPIMASISIRESIRWLPLPASEPTSTLVLTSPGRHFVDIRILHAPLPSPAPSSADTGDSDSDTELPPARLDWAFAGISSASAVLCSALGLSTGIEHAKFAHVVDSRTRARPEDVVDEGYMSSLGDGRTLEKGRMVNPATGAEADYEEVWRDVAPAPGALCVVLELRREEREERGVVVCLGGYCQGVVRCGEAFAAERWVRSGTVTGEGTRAGACGRWKREARVGNLWMPCSAAMEDAALAVGGRVERGGQVWNVIEATKL